jgi:hypothetical protein
MQPPDLRDMARCCKNLGHFGAENSAVKGYIAMMPLFQRSSEHPSHPPWRPGSSQTDKRSYELQKNLKELIESVANEKSVFSVVFSTWQVRFLLFPARCPGGPAHVWRAFERVL